MTHSQTTQTGRGGEGARFMHQEKLRLAAQRAATVRSVLKGKAQSLQRQGNTLSEIAETLDCRRETIVNLLYWEVVRDDR